MKLQDIINELSINKPLSDRDMFDYIIEPDTWKDGRTLIQDFHLYDTLEEYIKEDIDEDDEDDKIKIKYAVWYYNKLKKNDIHIFEVEDSESGDEVFSKPYK